MTSGDKIRDLRKSRGLSQEDLAKLLGVKKAAVSKWENGTVQNIKRSTIVRMCEVFGVHPYEILMFDGEGTGNVIPMPVMHRVPLLGEIACGQPITAEENFEGEVDVPDNITADFALRCKGDSMINARIFDGDLVYIHSQPIVENGQIAAVYVEEQETEATLKRVHLYDDHIVLEPENPMYKPLVFWGEDMNKVQIIGKAVAFTSMIR